MLRLWSNTLKATIYWEQGRERDACTILVWFIPQVSTMVKAEAGSKEIDPGLGTCSPNPNSWAISRHPPVSELWGINSGTLVHPKFQFADAVGKSHILYLLGRNDPGNRKVWHGWAAGYGLWLCQLWNCWSRERRLLGRFKSSQWHTAFSQMKTWKVILWCVF